MTSYQALTYISHPRKDDKDKQTDLIGPGDTIDLTDDEAAMYLPPRRVPAVIRLAKESGEPLPRMAARSLFGVAVNPRTGKRIGRPGPPADARPDPEGSSAIQVMVPPEANEPQPGDETSPVDAEDIPPRGQRGRAGAKAG